MYIQKYYLSAILCVVAALFALKAEGSPALYVIEISVDGLGSSYLSSLITDNSVPNFARLKNQGVSTLNARDDYDYTITLPNHVTMITARPVLGSAGHNWTINSDPEIGQTIHSNKGSYVDSVFDVANENGLRTAMYATKSKFSLFENSYPDEIDTFLYNDDSASITNSFISDMSANPFNYSFIHFDGADTAGHDFRWGSDRYNQAIMTIDGYIGQILNMIDNNPALSGQTAIIVTADHGGNRNEHSTADNPLNYTIPFIAWGAGCGFGQDLYALNAGIRLDPADDRPDYDAALQPIRSGDGANLALELLGLGPIPGSTINCKQDLIVPEPATVLLIAAGLLIIRKTKLSRIVHQIDKFVE